MAFATKFLAARLPKLLLALAEMTGGLTKGLTEQQTEILRIQHTRQRSNTTIICNSLRKTTCFQGRGGVTPQTRGMCLQARNIILHQHHVFDRRIMCDSKVR